MLDVSAGTGDFLPLLAGQGCQAWARTSPAMMRRAGEMASLGRCHWWREMPCGFLPDATFDGLVNGFLLRNVADLDAALAEMRRVLKPGGLAVCLEITWPRLPLFREAFGLYFGRLVPLLGRLISRDPEAYSYLPSSVAAFVSASELAERMQAVGFREVAYRRLALGAVALHRGVR